MKNSILIILSLMVLSGQKIQKNDEEIEKIQNIIEYVRKDIAVINGKPTCFYIEGKTAHLLVNNKFNQYLIDSVYNLRPHSIPMNISIYQSARKIDSLRKINFMPKTLPIGSYRNDCLEPKYELLFDFYSDSICIVNLARYELGTGKNWSYLFKTDTTGKVVNVLRAHWQY